MKNLSATFITLLFIFISLSGYSQSSEKKGILYSSSVSAGFQLYSKGWNTNLEFTKIKDFRNSTFLKIELGQLKSEKEIRQTLELGFSIAGINSPKPFVYAKQNNFYNLNILVGKQTMLGERSSKNGVEVSLKYSGGFSLGILKPYYLQLIRPIDNQTYYLSIEKYNPEDAAFFIEPNNIYGSAGFSRGLNELKFLTGGQLRAGLNFDWAMYDDFIKSIEVGVVANVYSRRVPIMIISNNKQFFTNFYLGIQFGKKKA
jgi:hypothetical protein